MAAERRRPRAARSEAKPSEVEKGAQVQSTSTEPSAGDPFSGSRREARQRFEPWPWALALALAAMIGGSLAFLAIATAHPDPVVERHPAAEDPRAAK